MRKSTRIVGILVTSIVIAAACTTSEPGVGSRSPSASSIASVSIADWPMYENSTYGLSFRYPSSMTLLIDQPVASGIQLQGDRLNLSIIANPRTQDTVGEFSEQLRSRGFTERNRSSITKGPWTGLRLEGVAENRLFDLELDEVVYLVKSQDSLLVLIALWSEPPPEYQVADAIWQSLNLEFDEFVLSPAFSGLDSLTTFSAPDGSLTLRYPTQWQVGAMGGSTVSIFDPSNPDAVLIIVKHEARLGASLSEALQNEFDFVSAGFRNVITSSEKPYSVNGTIEATGRSGLLEFKDGVPGEFQLVVAISADQILTVSAIYQAAEAESVRPILEEVLRSLEVR